MLVCLLNSFCMSTTTLDESVVLSSISLGCFTEFHWHPLPCKIWGWVVVDQRLMAPHFLFFFFVLLIPQNSTLKVLSVWLCGFYPLSIQCSWIKQTDKKSQDIKDQKKWNLPWLFNCFFRLTTALPCKTCQLYFLLCISHDALRGRLFYSLGN